MTADEFVELLGGARPVGRGKWNAACPAHVDKMPSLSVTEGADRVLIHCHAGCSLTAILIELGLTWHDIFHDTPAPETAPDAPEGYVYVGYFAGRSLPANGRRGSTRRRPEEAVALPEPAELAAWQASIGKVAKRLRERKGWSATSLRHFELGFDGSRVTIPVRDKDGQLVSLLRYRPGAPAYKMLAPRHAGRHLFPAPEKVKVADVWLVEGEPDAITAFELGLPAVAVPGVSCWKSDWTERFIGRTVTICFDADVQGREAAETRRADFESLGIPARVVDIAPSKISGYDLSDALVDAIRLDREADLRRYLTVLTREAWSAAA